MNKRFIPTPQDEALRMEASITKTAGFNGTTKDLGDTFAPGGIGMGIAAVVNVTALFFSANAPDQAYAFVAEESYDGGTNWSAIGPNVSATEVGAISVPGFLSTGKVRVRLATASGTTPSITYEVWLNLDLA